LFGLLKLVSWNHLLVNLFFSNLIWGNVILCPWGSSLLVYVFLWWTDSTDIKRY
jgi:hypothetical protein